MKQWLMREGMWLPANYTGPLRATHVFLDGGKAHVPHQRVPEFLAEYASRIEARAPPHDLLCVVERLAACEATGGRFKMFMDVDLKASDVPTPPADADLHHLARCILSCAPLSLRRGAVIVCKSTSATSATTKTGLHLVWQDVHVTASEAQALVGITTSNLAHDVTASMMAVDWGAALDGSVYRNSGLRMTFSSKGPRAPTPSMYLPWMVVTFSVSDMSEVDPDVEIINDPWSDVLTWVRRCSIIPDEVKASAVDAGPAEPARSHESDTRIIDGVDAALQGVLSGTPYEGVRYRVGARKENTMFIMLDSKFCHNVNREHKSNNVYLIVTKRNVQQACFCWCADTGCAEARHVVAGEGNALSAAIFGSSSMPTRARARSTNVAAVVMPSTTSHAIECLAARIKRQRLSN
ncbi:hypothetical protein HYH03_017294 [Edaphochlamys debaryana]|uniref:C962R-like N-terminal AEP domain-containing protein n=1 Tax=Edaphochlamys debaryana TaxID=47281 RepID=A0A835XIA2_9CHLO|nr:hypothetical protein HYH03_017294 [Edaphochlamys debaryana]|eukprot:KAG2483900.1 hypothetical protein HYH03_017294 [Edaphochlamys debaryana]